MQSRQLAIIDLGTNTFHLLIVDVKSESISILFKEKVAVKIGEGGINQGKITEAAEKRALETLRYFKKVIGKFKITEIHASATSAIRNAANGLEFKERVKNELAIDIEIISGVKEAELIHKGVSKAMEIGPKNALIMDIGGGSVEFIIANNDGVLWLESYEIGGQRLYEKFHKEEPIAKSSLKKLEQYFDQELKSLKNAIDEFKPHSLIGCSGTFDTLVDMLHYRMDKEKVEKTTYEIPLEDYYLIHEEVIHKNLAERLVIPGMIPMRAEMIVVACSLIKYCLQLADFPKVRVSTYALKEGYLDHILNQTH